jgi:SAM-dependent methyltransferase
VNDAAEAALRSEQAFVHAGWETVDLLGTLGRASSKKVLAYRWEAEQERGTSWFRPMNRPTEFGAKAFAAYESPSTQTRFRRTLDFLQEGDRILEVGTGRGYVGGLMLRDGGASAYLGMEISPAYVKDANRVLEFNELADRGRVVEGDLYALDGAAVAYFRPDLVVCCEVLEHVDDPEKALRSLVDILPEQAELLVSVPVERRLERVWGHVSIFDADRTRRMIESAGLHVHAVDVSFDTWVLILASRDEGASPRAAAAAAAWVQTKADPPPRPGPRSIHRVDLSAVRPARAPRGVKAHTIEHGKGGAVILNVAATRRGVPRLARHRAGVAFDVEAARGLRLEFDLSEGTGLRAIVVSGYAGSELVSSWRWNLGRKPVRETTTFVFGEQRPDSSFVQQVRGDLERADSIEVVAEVAAGGAPTVRLTRAAVLR